MWDDGNDAEFLRALEESRRFYEEVEVPRLSQQVRTPSPVTISDEDSLPGPSTSKQSSSEGLFKRPLLPVHGHQNEDLLPGPSTSAQSHIQDPFKKPQVFVSQDDKENEHAYEFYDGPDADGFSFKNGKIWVYPTSDNFPVRAYQRSIAETALFNNTLVSLPTGLGKTFIAAVVMYNFYMWYPKGKIIFMAPTKPLVAQQIDNCIDIMGIPESHTAEMTGAMHSKLRAGIWREKRVFFLTPQVVQNDLTANICPANAVKCVVIDEAHRALGDHAYAQVIRILNSYEARFRVLALSATPGSDLEAVQKVVSNLMISHIELREEDSPDIVQYTHERNLEKMVVDVGPTITRIRAKLVGIAADYAQRLQQLKLLFGTINSIPRFTVLKEWECFRREKSNTMDPATCNKINSDFATVLVFVHGLELLQTYGLRLLLKHLKNALNKGDQTSNRLSLNEELKALMEEIDGVLNPIVIDGEEEGGIKKKIYGHPKLDCLQEVVVSHFENFERKGEATRAIVFCEYREGVIEICDMLKNYEPLVKPVVFMGQSTGKGGKGISQKQQLEIMDKFKEGSYNTLISTSVGEEGLDIGEVDLIICFDAKNSPIRQVQRMGRTGRKRQGRIIMLLTRGKEEQKYNQGLFKKKNIKAVLVNKENLANHLLDESPRMLPPGIQPKYTERNVEPSVRKPRKSNQQDLRKMFAKKSSAGTSGSSHGGRSIVGNVDYLSEDEFEELKSLWDIQDCLQFRKIPERVEVWTQSSDEIKNCCLTSTNIDLSTYLEFFRYPQRTHIVGNSSDSKLLSELLMWADERKEGDESTLFKGISSQVTSTQMWPPKSNKRGRPPKDTNSTHPHKKRGRPKKNTTINSHFLPKLKEDSNEALAQPSKPKSKFIEDDEEEKNTPEISKPILKTPKHEPSPSKLLSPSILQPVCQSVSPDLDSRTSTVLEADVVTLNSDDEDDIIACSSNGYAVLSSQVSKQNLYGDLSKALRNQNFNEEEDCNICDTLFLCKSLNKLVLEKKVKKVKESWKDVSKLLEKSLVLVPHITREKWARHDPESKSGSMELLIPKFDFVAEDEMFDGLLCGGVGDLSPPRAASPLNEKLVILPHSKTTPSEMAKKESCTLLEFKQIDLEDKKLLQSFSSSPKKLKEEPSIKTKQTNAEFEAKSELADDKISTAPKKTLDEFEDVSFDFLGLSKIDDIFFSQKSDGEVKNLVQNNNAGDSCIEKPSSFMPMKISSQLLNEVGDNIQNHQQECCSQAPSNSQTPPKAFKAVANQVSPILCSQVLKKPRLGLRLRKQMHQDEKLRSKGKTDHDNDVQRKENLESTRGGFSSHEKVTSSFPLIQTPHVMQAPVVNFDLFDDSLLELSDDEDKRNKVSIDEALKEAIVQKAFEAKSKGPEITFTQEVSKMCEANVGGLTQVMEMYDAKDMRQSVIIERADSSSAQLEEDWSYSPNSLSHNELNDAQIEDVCESTNQSIIRGASEEDLFADCDDSVFCHIDSFEQLPTTPAKSVSKNSAISPEKKNHSPDACEEMGAAVSKAIDDPERSTSPIFKPSQLIKRQSKLRLKKVNVDKPVFVKEPSPSSKAPICSTSKTPKKETCERSEPTGCSPINFNMFGDEFNNSWKYSQEKQSSSKDFQSKSENDGASVLCERQSESKCDTVGYMNAKIELQRVKSSRESSSDSDLEAAFAKMDADRKEKKKSFDTALSSTPKILKTKSFLQQEQPSIKPTIGFLPKKKLSLKDAVSSTKVNMKSGWICAGPREQGSHETSSTLKEASLLDFCDNSLLEHLLTHEEQPSIQDLNCSKTTDKILAKDNYKGKETSNRVAVDCGKLQRNIVPVEPGSRKKLSLSNKSATSGLSRGHCSIKSSAKMTEKEEKIVVLSSSDEEDVVKNQRRGRKRLNLTSSSEEDLNPNQVVAPASSVKKEQHDLNSSLSSRGSIVSNRHPPHSNVKSALDLSAFCDDSILNDLINDDEKESSGREIKNSDSSDEDVFMHTNRDRLQDKRKAYKKRKSKKKSSRKRNGFIMSEAGVSEDDHHLSSDGESTSLDELDSSFINDSQPEASQSVVDIHHKYLEAVRSPARAAGRFKIPNYLPAADINIYSQYPDASELDQTYANDSFCVDDEPTQYEPEMSLLELAEAKLKAERKERRKRKRNNYNADSSGSDDIQVNNKAKGKRLKRIKVFEETILEDGDQAKSELESVPLKMFSNDNNVKSSIDSHQTSNNQNNDLAKLLDDDVDFSFIPDTFEAAVDCVPDVEKPISSKFVKKTSFKMNPNFNKANISSAVQGLASSSSVQNSMFKNVNPSNSLSLTSIRPVLSTKQKIAPCATVTSASNQSQDLGQLTPTFIIASSKQIAQSPDVLRVLRVSHHIVIVPHSVPDADYILSWRKGAIRLFASDLKDRKKLDETVKKLKQSFSIPCLIVENDRLKLIASLGPQKKGTKSNIVAPAVVDPGSNSLSPWTSPSGCTNATLLRQAGVQLLFSQNSDETAGYLAKLARREANIGHGIPAIAQNVSDEVESRLEFFACLPGINYAFAFKLLSKFGTLADFLKRCSSVNNIASSLGVDFETSRKIHKLLCEVYFSP